MSQTGVWGVMESLVREFSSPLRQVLSETRAQGRRELQVKREEWRGGRGGGSAGSAPQPEFTVKVGSHGDGGSLPEPSLQDEISVSEIMLAPHSFIMCMCVQILEIAQQQMDMMESVLVRVEELMN